MTWYEEIPAFVHCEPKIVKRESLPDANAILIETLERWIAALEQWLIESPD